MNKIRQLPEEVANQISAGEVIERPASVVKELVENSIDAGSTKISIEVENGGKDKIRVKDNGSGISSGDLDLAFSRYATSKIKDINDLYSIKSLGFRGEALASIASVARIELKTKTKLEIKGNIVKMEGGKEIARKPAGIPVGTDITVKDLFFNTPARYKYLKTVSTEFGHISNVIEREALAYPAVQFTLKNNNKMVLKTPGSGKMLDVIYAIFGEELVKNLVEIDYKDRYIHLKGFLAKPVFHRASRIYEYFFVNNRSVHNQILARGLEEGYRGLLPPGRYPAVFLTINLNRILVDINVHPTKREIKFSRDEIVKDVVYQGVKSVLKNINASPALRLNKLNNVKRSKIDDKLEEKKKGSDHDKGDFNNKKTFSHEKTNRRYDNIKDKKKENLKLIKDNDYSYQLSYDHKGDNLSTNHNVDKIKKSSKNNKYQEEERPVQRLYGQMDNTYLIAEGKDGLYIIDQHNAHERVRYERLKDEYNKKRIAAQTLLVPISLEVTLQEKELINEYKDDLAKLGFLLEEFGGNSFLVQEAPSLLKKASIKQVIRELIDKIITSGKTMEQAEMVDRIITFIACRGAIKAGKKLAREEMEELINSLFKTSNPHRCPHGRPVILHIDDEEIQKGMGR